MPVAKSTTLRLWEVPAGAGVAMLAAGLAALAAHTVLLFPSLGPTALMQAHSPEQKASRPYNAIAGHALGLSSAFLFVWVFGLARAPSVFEAHDVSAPRVWASVCAIVLAALLELILKAEHPPAASTTLLASLGSFKPTWGDTGRVIVGVVIVVIVGDAVRRLRLRR